MSLLLDGIKVGFILCFLIGPIFFTLIQTGIEEGFRAGFVVGLGVWMSDFMYIVGAHWGLVHLSRWMEGSNTTLYLGIVGSFILIGFGISAIFTAQKLKALPTYKTQRSSSFFKLWLKGFLINAFNPFTILFWIGVISTVVVKDELAGNQALVFFGGLIGTVVLTDLLKVLLAKHIRRWLRPVHLIWFRRVSGVALIGFGVMLMVRVLLA